ncbi:MAG: hypothetical protein AB1529_04480 [Candidatus Micrarchaeota archaeon]
MGHAEIRIREYERELQRKVNKALSSVEVAIAQWDLSKDRPAELAETIEALRKFHKAFSEWERASVMGCGAGEDLEASACRLEKFADLCREFEGRI